MAYSSFFFFFQAEDGIRDLTVTGVQTCALPISRPLELHRDRLDPEGAQGDTDFAAQRRPYREHSVTGRRARQCSSGVREDGIAALSDATPTRRIACRGRIAGTGRTSARRRHAGARNSARRTGAGHDWRDAVGQRVADTAAQPGAAPWRCAYE